MVGDENMSIPFADQIVGLEGLELVEEAVDFLAGDTGILGESDKLLGRSRVEIVQGHDWELDRHLVLAVVIGAKGVCTPYVNFILVHEQICVSSPLFIGGLQGLIRFSEYTLGNQRFRRFSLFSHAATL